jgi:hypothetical protein
MSSAARCTRRCLRRCGIPTLRVYCFVDCRFDQIVVPR